MPFKTKSRELKARVRGKIVDVRSRTSRGSRSDCSGGLKQARGKESPMQQKVIPVLYLLNCLASNTSSNRQLICMKIHNDPIGLRSSILADKA